MQEYVRERESDTFQRQKAEMVNQEGSEFSVATLETNQFSEEVSHKLSPQSKPREGTRDELVLLTG